MAYEAMNNAGAMDSRLIVILNDNDMSIAPPVGAMSAYLATPHLRRDLPAAPQLGEAARQDPAQGLGAPGGARRGIHPRLLDRRHAVRGDGLLLCRPDRRAQFRSSASGLAQRARHAERPDPGPRRDPEGQGLRHAENSADKFHGVGRFNVVTGAQEPSSGGAPSYTKVFANALIEEAKADDEDRRDHRGDAVRHRARPLRGSLPRALLRRRHRRAACGDLRRRVSPPKASSRSPPSIRPSSSAPTTRWCTTSPSRTCRSASPSTGPGWSAPTARPMPALSTWPISPACRASW